MGTVCPNGYTNVDGICYENCPSGYSQIENVCYENCLLGWDDLGTTCQKPPNSEYVNGAGFDTQFDCENVAGKCYQCGGMFYPNCYDGYSPVNCNKCAILCPSNTDNPTENICNKRKITDRNAQPAELSWGIIFLIVMLVILALGIFFQVIRQGYITNEEIFDLEYGVPGESDAYAVITGKRESQKLYYI